MNKIIETVKRYWILILIVLAVILSITNAILKGPQKASPSPTPFTNKVADFEGLQPGKASIENVNKLLGLPVKSKNEGPNTILEYRTTNQYVHDVVIAQGDTIKLIREAINIEDKKTTQSVTDTYGTPPTTLYEQAANSVFNLYVYPQNGIAYLGHADGTLFEVWYFEPTTLDNFISNWAPNYSQKQFTGQSKY